MNSRYEGALTGDELAYVRQRRRNEGLPHEMARHLIVFAALAVIVHSILSSNASLFRGGFTPFNIVVGLIALAVLAAPLLALSFRRAPKVKYKVCTVSGRLSFSPKERQHYIDGQVVRFPRHWRTTLESRSKPITARAAKREDASWATPEFPLYLLDVEDGPSIRFETEQAGGRMPPERFWGSAILGALALPTAGAIAFLIASDLDDLDYAASLRAAYASYFERHVYISGNGVDVARPTPRRWLTIHDAWLLDARHLDPSGVPSNATVVVIGQTVRDRIATEREATTEAYRKAWKEYEEALSQYNSKNMVSLVYDGNGYEKVGGAPPDTPAPVEPKAPLLQLAQGDIVAYFDQEPDAAPNIKAGSDPISQSLSWNSTIKGITQSTDRPLLLKPFSLERRLSERGHYLAGSLAVIGAMGVILALAVQHFVRLREFVGRVRKAYDAKGGFVLE